MRSQDRSLKGICWDSFLPVLKGFAPRQLVVQFTDQCNAQCPQCGMRVSNRFPRTKLPVDQVKGMIDHAAENDFEAISFTGGEPLLAIDEICVLINHAYDAGIRLTRTGTNGFLFKNPSSAQFADRVKKLVEKLANTPLYTFWISIDSADSQTHETMRGFQGVIRGIERALPVFHENGIFPAANLGINRNIGGFNDRIYQVAEGQVPFCTEEFYQYFRESFRRFYQFLLNLGFTMANACYPMSGEGSETTVYAASSEDLVVSFSPQEKLALFQSFFDIIPEFRHQLRIFSPRSSILSLIRELKNSRFETFPCRGGLDYFFISARDGHTYPCGYRGEENLGNFLEFDFKSGSNLSPSCRECEWECFRDPSTLLGPLLNPFSIVKSMLGDREFLRVWVQDMAYARACHYFNGRKAPDFQRLNSFSSDSDVLFPSTRPAIHQTKPTAHAFD